MRDLIPTPPWDDIDTVLLDMDGTLLDLHFDDHFWQDHLPARYAEKYGISLAAAKAHLVPLFRSKEGTLDWYSVDYWSRELGMEVALLKAEVAHLIAVHPHVPDFLERLRARRKRVALVTNAHMHALELKMERTQLAGHFDAIITSHELGLPKEDLGFWQRLQTYQPFAPGRTMMIDDSLPVLRAARAFGLAHLICIRQPSTRRPPRDLDEFPALSSFMEIMPD